MLRSAGWIVVVFNENRKSRVRNWVDMAAMKGGHIWLIEIKGEGDRLRPGQKEFSERIKEHTGERLHYALVREVEQFEEIIEGAQI